MKCRYRLFRIGILFILLGSNLPISTSNLLAQSLADFQVNDNAGRCEHQYPTVACDSIGNFLMVWQDERNGNFDIFGQRYQYDGSPLGNNFLVNQHRRSGIQRFPDIGMNAADNGIVVWQDNSDGEQHIYGQRLAKNGELIGENFRIDASPSNAYPSYPKAAMAPNGSFIVVWEDHRNGNVDIFARRFNSAGQAEGDDFLINDDTSNLDQAYPDIAFDAAGNYAIVWEDGRNGNKDIFCQRYNSDGDKIGLNFKINDDTGSDLQERPSIAFGIAGTFVISWTDYRHFYTDVFCQRYDALGNKIGTNFRVNDDDLYRANYNAHIAIDGSDNFVIVWQENRNAANHEDIYCQRFNGNGARIGANFRLNEDPGTAQQYNPQVAISTGGDFIAVWVDERHRFPDIYAQRYKIGGTKVQNNFMINDDTSLSGHQTMADIAVASKRNFVIVWQDARSGKCDIYGQQYRADGSRHRTNFKINDDVGNVDQLYPAVAMDDSGNFVVVWEDYRNLTTEIYGQRFNSIGARLGGNFKINDDLTSSGQFEPDIGMDANGNFVVVWQDYRNGDADIYGQSLDKNGIKIGANFKISDDSENLAQATPKIAMNASGNFVVVWQDDRRQNSDIYGQRFDFNGKPVEANFKINDDTGTAIQLNPAVALDGFDNIFVLWTDLRNFGWDVYGQRFNSWGWNLGGNFKINDDVGNNLHAYPEISADASGNSSAVWVDNRYGSYDIFRQVFNPEGDLVGANVRVNGDIGTFDQNHPSVQITNRQIYYAWEDNRMAGQGYDIFAQVELLNHAPESPGLLLPKDKSYIRQQIPTLVFSTPSDGDDDPIHFRVEIATDSNFVNPVSGSPFFSRDNPTGFYPNPPVPTDIGNCSYTLQTVLADDHYFWRIFAYDGFEFSKPSPTFSFILDTTPPTTTAHIPEKNAVEVALNAVITFHLQDPGSGVDSSRILLKVNQQAVTPVITGTPADYRVSYDSELDFDFQQTIAIAIDAHDRAGNPMITENYIFTTITRPNQVPEPPILLSPRAEHIFRSLPLQLTWQTPDDDDQDSLHFNLELDSLGIFTPASWSFFSASEPDGFDPIPPVPAGSDSVRFTLGQPIPEGVWFWRVIAWDGHADSPPSDIRTFRVNLAPNSPRQLRAQSGHQQIILSWLQNIESDISHYLIYCSESPDFIPASEDSIGRVAHPDTTFIHTGLTHGSIYYYRIAAVDSIGNRSAWSDQVSAAPSAPIIYLPFTTHDFGTTIIGAEKSWDLHIQNQGSERLEIYAINRTLTAFSLNDSTASIAGNDSLNLTITFRPEAIRHYQDTLKIISNDPIQPIVHVALAGDGIATPAPDLVLRAWQHDFGAVTVGTPAAWTLAIKNTGTDTLIITNIRTKLDEFTFAADQAIIPENEELDLTLVFQPTSAQSYQDTLWLASNDPDQPLASVILIGTGVYPVQAAIEVLPNPFTPNGDGYNDYVEFKYPDMYVQTPLIQIFNVQGRKVREITAAANNLWRWYGTDDAGRELAPGLYIYILALEGQKISSGTLTLIR